MSDSNSIVYNIINKNTSAVGFMASTANTWGFPNSLGDDATELFLHYNMTYAESLQYAIQNMTDLSIPLSQYGKHKQLLTAVYYGDPSLEYNRERPNQNPALYDEYPEHLGEYYGVNATLSVTVNSYEG